MNKARKAQLRRIDDKLAPLITELREVLEAEQSAFDNMPESLQMSERGTTAEEAVDYLDEAVSTLEDARTTIANIIGY